MPAFIVVHSEQLSVLAIDAQELANAMQGLQEVGVGCCDQMGVGLLSCRRVSHGYIVRVCSFCPSTYAQGECSLMHRNCKL
jgi:hypothetical protein